MKHICCKFLMVLVTSAWLLPGPGRAADKLPVTASFSILADLVGVVGGDRVSVTALVGPDEDAHVFEPKPADARAIVQSRMLVINGLGFEPWAQKLAKAASFSGTVVVASSGVKPRASSTGKDHGTHAHAHLGDPHAWQNPNNVIVYVRNIAAALVRLDPAGAAIYQANSAAYIKDLQALDSWAKDQFAAIAPGRRKAITSHDAFGYLAEHYGITFLAPQGISTGTEPSARQIAQLIRQIQREKIKAVFVENMSSPRLLAQLSRDAGISPGASLYADALSSAGKPGATYLQMMRHNVTQLVAGMKLN